MGGSVFHARIEERWKMVINTPRRRRRGEPGVCFADTNRHTCDSSLQPNNNETKESKKNHFLCVKNKRKTLSEQNFLHKQLTLSSHHSSSSIY